MKHYWIMFRWAVRLIKELNSADYYKIIIEKDGNKSVEEVSKDGGDE